MKINKENMIKLGFQKFGKIWQHRNQPNLKYENPDWVGFVGDIYITGYIKGKEDNQAAIRKALDIR
jgi:hypothetical protein